MSPFLANHFRFSDFFLLFVETISPLFKKKSDILIAWDKSPPGLFLKSKIYAFIFLLFSNFLIFFCICSLLFSLKDVSLIYPILFSSMSALTDCISIISLIILNLRALLT